VDDLGEVRAAQGPVRGSKEAIGRGEGGTPIAARCDASGRGTAGGLPVPACPTGGRQAGAQSLD